MEFMRWRHCILIGPGDSRCWGHNPPFDETSQKYTCDFDDRAVPRINPTRSYSKLEKRDQMHFNSPLMQRLRRYLR